MAKVVKRKILVELDYHDFIFDDLFAANAFAAEMKSHLADNDADAEVKITVNYDFVEEEQDDQTTD
jgi:hypothetical protein